MSNTTSTTIPIRFQPAYQAVRALAQHERYQAALIFGSLVRGESTAASDIDIHVIIDEDNPCTNVNHPMINGVKLDITFISFQQLLKRTEREIELRERIPIVAESLLVFDKTGELTALRMQAGQVRRKAVPESEHQYIQFMFYHGNNKVERNLVSDPVTALLAMHVGLNDFLHYHYRLQQRWWVSSKRLLADLHVWDAPLARLIETFVITGEVQAKFAAWSAILDHILLPLGGRQPIEENNCACEVCREDLALL